MLPNQGKALLSIGRTAIAHALHVPYQLDVDETASWLQEMRACFVTLIQNDELRGCIGTLEAHQSLLVDVKSNAVSAALYDPRFLPLKPNKFACTDIEISLLSSMKAMDFQDEVDALAQMRPGIDGIVLEYGRYRSTFLPQVWDELSQPQLFLNMLKRKAGLPVDFWSKGVRLLRYTVTKWRETDDVEVNLNG
jgi:uncharacterized protein